MSVPEEPLNIVFEKDGKDIFLSGEGPDTCPEVHIISPLLDARPGTAKRNEETW